MRNDIISYVSQIFVYIIAIRFTARFHKDEYTYRMNKYISTIIIILLLDIREALVVLMSYNVFFLCLNRLFKIRFLLVTNKQFLETPNLFLVRNLSKQVTNN